MTEPKTETLEVPGAVLAYDVRASDSATQPVLLLIGSPMGASGFAALAGHFTDRTVVTYDPRSAGRSTRTDGAGETTPDEHADDLHRLIGTLDAGPADIFASSGGAVNALALVAQHPEQVRTLVAHEPPAAQELADREPALAVCRDIRQTYQRSGYGPAMAKFIALVSHEGPIPAGFADQPGPDPAAFGLPAEDDGARNDPLLEQNIVTCLEYQHDFGALRAAPTRIVIGVGAESGQVLPARAAVAVAERLGTAPVTFPGDHGGFFGDGDPGAFALTLRQVLGGLAPGNARGYQDAIDPRARLSTLADSRQRGANIAWLSYLKRPYAAAPDTGLSGVSVPGGVSRHACGKGNGTWAVSAISLSRAPGTTTSQTPRAWRTPTRMTPY